MVYGDTKQPINCQYMYYIVLNVQKTDQTRSSSADLVTVHVHFILQNKSKPQKDGKNCIALQKCVDSMSVLHCRNVSTVCQYCIVEMCRQYVSIALQKCVDSMLVFVFHLISSYTFIQCFLDNIQGTVEVMIVWQLDLQLPMQSLPITTNIVNSNPDHGKVYSMQLEVVSDFLRVLRFPPSMNRTATK